MKKHTQDSLDDDFVNTEFKRETNKTIKKKKAHQILKEDILKYVRLVQITNMILATIFLARQNFLYAQFLSAVVGICTAERIWYLVFRNR